jgi:hypothetical protein
MYRVPVLFRYRCRLLAACLFKMAGAGWCVVHLFRYRCRLFSRVSIKDVRWRLVCGAPI